MVLLTSGDKRVASLSQDLHQVVSEVPASQVQTHDGMWQGITLIDGHIVCDTIARVQHNTYGKRNRCRRINNMGCKAFLQRSAALGFFEMNLVCV